jgi:hypothetical protein
MADSDQPERVDWHVHEWVNSQDPDCDDSDKRLGTENASNGSDEHVEKGSGSSKKG